MRCFLWLLYHWLICGRLTQLLYGCGSFVFFVVVVLYFFLLVDNATSHVSGIVRVTISIRILQFLLDVQIHAGPSGFNACLRHFIFFSVIARVYKVNHSTYILLNRESHSAQISVFTSVRLIRLRSLLLDGRKKILFYSFLNIIFW